MKEWNFSSGDEYADKMIEDINMFDFGMPNDLKEYWCKELRQMCNSKFLKYIEGEEESYMLTDVELEEAYKVASEKLIGETLGVLVDKGMVSMSVGENGEVLYSATDKGREQIK